jgi:hypothetical protein
MPSLINYKKYSHEFFPKPDIAVNRLPLINAGSSVVKPAGKKDNRAVISRTLENDQINR